MSVRNAEFVPALFLLLLFLMYRKIPRIRNPNSLFALLCLFVYEELSGLWPKDLGSDTLGFIHVYCTLLPHSTGAFVVFV